MKKLLLSISILILSLSLSAQRYNIIGQDVCWNTGSVDSSLTRYFLVSTQTSEVKILTYLNASGDTVTVSGGSFTQGYCDCCGGSSGSGGSDSGLASAKNGLSLDADSVILGGILKMNTSISGIDSFGLDITTLKYLSISGKDSLKIITPDLLNAVADVGGVLQLESSTGRVQYTPYAFPFAIGANGQYMEWDAVGDSLKWTSPYITAVATDSSYRFSVNGSTTSEVLFKNIYTYDDTLTSDRTAYLDGKRLVFYDTGNGYFQLVTNRDVGLFSVKKAGAVDSLVIKFDYGQGSDYGLFLEGPGGLKGIFSVTGAQMLIAEGFDNLLIDVDAVPNDTNAVPTLLTIDPVTERVGKVASSSVSSSMTTYVIQTTAPTDTVPIWIDSSGSDSIYQVKKYIDGGWLEDGYYTPVGNQFFDEVYYILNIGQSNAAAVSGSSIWPTNDSLYQVFNQASDTWVVYDLAGSSSNAWALGNKLIEEGRKVGKEVLIRLLTAPVGGTSITTYISAGQTGYDSLYSNWTALAKDRVFDIVTFHQGEADQASPNAWEVNFNLLLDTLGVHSLIDNNTKFLLFGLYDGEDRFYANAGLMNATFKGIANQQGEERLNFGYVSPSGLVAADQVHFSSGQKDTLGLRAYSLIHYLPRQPEEINLSSSESQIALDFNGNNYSITPPFVTLDSVFTDVSTYFYDWDEYVLGDFSGDHVGTDTIQNYDSGNNVAAPTWIGENAIRQFASKTDSTTLFDAWVYAQSGYTSKKQRIELQMGIDSMSGAATKKGGVWMRACKCGTSNGVGYWVFMDPVADKLTIWDIGDNTKAYDYDYTLHMDTMYWFAIEVLENDSLYMYDSPDNGTTWNRLFGFRDLVDPQEYGAIGMMTQGRGYTYHDSVTITIGELKPQQIVFENTDEIEFNIDIEQKRVTAFLSSKYELFPVITYTPTDSIPIDTVLQSFPITARLDGDTLRQVTYMVTHAPTVNMDLRILIWDGSSYTAVFSGTIPAGSRSVAVSGAVVVATDERIFPEILTDSGASGLDLEFKFQKP